MAKLGDVSFNVISESRTYPNEVTSHPVEKGVDITDHVKVLNTGFDIRGRVGDAEDPAKVHSLINAMRRNREITTYVGRGILKNCIVKEFRSDVGVDSRKGFSFSLQLVEIKISKPSTVSTLPVSLRVDKKDVDNAGRVQVI